MNSPPPILAPGQRWMSHAEPELGMGILVAHDKRTLSIHFPLADCHRQYSKGGAPVERIRFNTGEKIRTKAGNRLMVDDVNEKNGLLFYRCGESDICEKNLSGKMDISRPLDKLLTGIRGNHKAFDLRYDLLKQRAAYEKSGARGFLGGRIDLIPHQLFIAREICSRHLPRVLLSDETGLGKTIEACLIIHHLLATHRMSRVLIIVPEPLRHQWFVELFRKFNLSFTLAVEEALPQKRERKRAHRARANPFDQVLQTIISREFIQADPFCREQILSAGWDMVILDEAHHLLDHRDFYPFMARLSRKSDGLMMLTATPEQMGMATHFSQLRLLDPDRYPDFDAYRSQAQYYGKIAKAAEEQIHEGKDVTPLLDAYGPGRVVFRNRRRIIQGFPKKICHPLPMGAGPEVVERINREYLSPQTVNEKELKEDPRIRCLAELAKTIKPEKILVICRSKALVTAIDLALKDIIALDIARFEETMSLVQRDRQAAWFAKTDGARVFVCSEIGSEGRNFQFAHHLFLFDLPRNPELLEQRIGRVDRIGQNQDIHIHLPYVMGTPYALMAQWVHRGMGMIENNISGVHMVYKKFESRVNRLIHALVDPDPDPLPPGPGDLDPLIRDTAAYCTENQDQLNRGRDILMDLNSFKPGPAQDLIQAIEIMDQDPGLGNLLPLVFDAYGVEMDSVGRNLFKISQDIPTDETFPALSANGHVICFDRKTAIAREDINFLTWDSPWVNQVFDFFIAKGSGTWSTARLESPQAPGLFLETVWLLEIPPLPGMNAERFLSMEPFKIMVDHRGQERGLPSGSSLLPDNPAWFMDHGQIKNELIPYLTDKTAQLARPLAEASLTRAQTAIDQTLGRELDRLVALKTINPDIRQPEIDKASLELKILKTHIATAKLRLESLRLIRSEP